MLAWGEEGSPEVTTFFRNELRLAPTLVHWQRRTPWYLRNQCGHRFCEEGAVCETRQSDFTGSGERRGVKLVSPACNVKELMTLALHHPVTSESRHRPRLGGMNTAPASKRTDPMGLADQQHLSLSRPLSSSNRLPSRNCAIVLV